MADSVYKIYILNSNNTADSVDLKLKGEYSKVSKVSGADVVLKKEVAVQLYSSIILECLKELGYKKSDSKDSEEDSREVVDKLKDVGKKVGKAAGKAALAIGKEAAKKAFDDIFGDTFRILGGDVLVRAWHDIKYSKSMTYEYDKDASVKVNIYLVSEDENSKLKYMCMFDSTRSYNSRTNEIKPLYFDFNNGIYYFKKPKDADPNGKLIFSELSRIMMDASKTGRSIDVTNYKKMMRQVESICESFYVDIVDNGLEKIVASKKFSNFDDAYKYACKKARINRKSITGHVGLDRTLVCLSDDSLSEEEPWRVCDLKKSVSRPCKDLKQASEKLKELIKCKQYGILTKVKKAVICK